MNVKFPVRNEILYTQDLVYIKGVPGEVEFDVEEHEKFYVLRADGFGNFRNYGGGPLYIYKSALPDINNFIIDSQTCEAGGGEE